MHLHVLQQHKLLGKPFPTLLTHKRLVVGVRGYVLLEVSLAVCAPAANLATLGARVGKVDLSMKHQCAAVLEKLTTNLTGVLLPQVITVGSLDVQIEAVARSISLGADRAGEGTLTRVHAKVDAHRRLRLERLTALLALEGGTVGGVL